MQFTEAQRTVVEYFFTTSEGIVACATDNMPSSFWAYLAGSYSRSHEPIRERLLDSLFNGDTGISVDLFADAVRAGDQRFLCGAMSIAERFLSKWAVEYGHNSLKDSSIDRFAVEGCSILAAKAFEDSELGAYQEKSTRYLEFSVQSVEQLVIPERFKDDSGAILDDVRDALISVFSAYTSVLTYWEGIHYNEASPSDYVNDAARRRTARAKAFDKARYYLPTCVKTSFGATISTRETVALLCRLLAHSSAEVRGLAELVLAEVRKVNPGLFTRMDPDYTDTFDMAALGVTHPFWPEPASDLPVKWESIITSSEIWTSKCPTVGALVQLYADETIKHRVASSFLSFTARRSGIASEFRPVAGITESLSNNAIGLYKDQDAVASTLSVAEQHYKKTRVTKHSGVPRYLDHVFVTFDIVMDYGAFRDLQRHRAGKQDIPTFLDSVGVIEFPGFDDMPKEIQAQCRAAVEDLRLARTDYEMPTYEGMTDGDYLRLLGHPVSWTYTCSLRQLVYLTELRSQASGHISYRVIAQEMASLVENYIPWLFPFLDRTAVASRADAENRTQIKLASISA